MQPSGPGLEKQAKELIGIRRRLEAPNPWARCEAAEQLGTYPWEAAGHIFEPLVKNDSHWGVGLAVANALAYYPHEQSDRLLKKLAEDHGDIGVRERASEILHDASRAKTNGAAHPHAEILTNEEFKAKMAELAKIVKLPLDTKPNGNGKIAGANAKTAGTLYPIGGSATAMKKIAASG